MEFFQPVNIKKKRRLSESLIRVLITVAAMLSILTTLGLVYELGKESILFFTTPGVTLREFFFTTNWQPSIGQFGILPLVLSTLITSFFAMLVAIPLGLGAAIYLSEYATPRSRGIIKPILEILAGIPTVVYGYFALTFMTPLLAANLRRKQC